MAAALDESALRSEMERLLLRHHHLVEASTPAPCTWVIEQRTLCWHVVLGEAFEPDIDIEQFDEVLVIRARVGGDLHVALIPVPGEFRASAPRCVFRAQVLEVRFGR